MDLENDPPPRSMCEGSTFAGLYGGFFPLTFNSTHTDS